MLPGPRADSGEELTREPSPLPGLYPKSAAFVSMCVPPTPPPHLSLRTTYPKNSPQIYPQGPSTRHGARHPAGMTLRKSSILGDGAKRSGGQKHVLPVGSDEVIRMPQNSKNDEADGCVNEPRED